MNRIIALTLLFGISIATAFSFNKKEKKKDTIGPITVGTVITLKQYDPATMPPQVANYLIDTFYTVTDGTRYKVLNNRVITVYENGFPSIYYVVDVQAVSASAPIQFVTWPTFYTKIAFGGGISFL